MAHGDGGESSCARCSPAVVIACARRTFIRDSGCAYMAVQMLPGEKKKREVSSNASGTITYLIYKSPTLGTEGLGVVAYVKRERP